MSLPIRLLVVGDDGMFEAGVSALALSRPDIVITGTSTDLTEAVGICRARPADVALIDLDMPGADGREATRRILAVTPSTKIVVVSSVQTPESIAAALAAGACGFVPRAEGPIDLAGAIRRAAAGEIVMPVVELRHVVGLLHHRRVSVPTPRECLDRLTARETQILTSMSTGDSTTLIAERLGISRLTVQSHVKNILAKLGVHSKIEAVTLAWRQGLAPVLKSA